MSNDENTLNNRQCLWWVVGKCMSKCDPSDLI